MKKILVVLIIIIMIVLTICLIPKDNNILIVVIPHHNLVKKERLDFWDKIITKTKIKTKEITKVIIIGPDHFNRDQRNIIYDDSDWSTYNTDLLNFFVRPNYFNNKYILNSKHVKNDHAIANLISEIHDYFPNTEFVPFLIGSDVKFNDLKPLQDYINSHCHKNCLLVASVDFSHYVTLDVANIQDERTIKLLSNMEITQNSFNQNDTIEADCPHCLYIMQEFARSKNYHWYLGNHTNSAFGNTETIETTSHLFGAYIK